jgi:predicted Zn-dependent protease
MTFTRLVLLEACLWVASSPLATGARLQHEGVQDCTTKDDKGCEKGQPNEGTLLAGCESKTEAACVQMQLGIQEFRSAQLDAALKHFQKAADLDPGDPEAHLYIGMSYFQQYVPGGDSPENVWLAEQALQALGDVLQIDSQNSTALNTLALIYYNMKNFDRAKEYQSRRVDIEPKNPEPYYWIGVLDWSLCYPRRMQLRKDLNLSLPPDLTNPDSLAPLPEEARLRLMGDNGFPVSEGIENLEKAIELKPDYDDAMAYLSLMYREKLDLEVDDAARASDLEAAGQWVQRAIEVRKRATQSNSSPNASQVKP